MTGEDRAEVIATLTKIGIAEDDIEFPSNFRFGPGSVSVSVEVAVKDLPEIGDLVLDAVEEVLGRSEASGVRFSLEDCDGALALARREAIPLVEGRPTSAYIRSRSGDSAARALSAIALISRRG